MLVNGVLTNAEIWYGLTEREVSRLEEIDRLFLRKLFQVPVSCPIEALYLETGCIPIRVIISLRRVKYLRHLLERDRSEMISKFFYCQWRKPLKQDWTEQVKRDLEILEISTDLNCIRNMKKYTFKQVVKEKARSYAFYNLLERKSAHSKLNDLSYYELRMQDYLTDQKISVRQARIIFKTRTRMTKYWSNYKGMNMSKFCPICRNDRYIDNQQHSFECKVIKMNIQIENEYAQVFGKIDENLAKTLENIEIFREEFLDEI